ASMPELMTAVLPETDEAVLALLEGKSVLAIGPGLGTEAATQKLVRQFVRVSQVPTVVDADGLNAFAENPDELFGDDDRPVIITPHPGEMSRLTGKSIEFITANRIEVAADFSQA